MTISKELMKGSTAMLVLSVISNEDMYGYRIIKELEGTLYPVLHSMEEDGLLTSYWVDVENRKRKYYHITHKGKKQLKEKAEEFKTYSAAVGRVLNFA